MTDETERPVELETESSTDPATSVATATSVADTAPESSTEAPEPVQRKVDRRIDRLMRDKYRLQAENEQLRQLAAQSAAAASAAPRSSGTGEPKAENFTDFESYLTARAEYIAKQTFAKEMQEQKELAQMARAAEVRQRMISSWNDRLRKASTEMPDFDEVVSAADAVQITPVVVNSIISAESGAAVLYHLARHPEEAEKLNSLSPDACARAIGRIEAKLEIERKAQTQSSAPRPVSASGGGSSAGKSPASMNPAEWAKWVRSGK